MKGATKFFLHSPLFALAILDIDEIEVVMKLSTKAFILVSVPVLFCWIQLGTLSYILSMYEKALVSAAIPLERIGVANLANVKLFTVCSAIFIQLLSISLALFFSRMLTKRIERACENLKRIQAGEAPNSSPEVSDEFRMLDDEILRTSVIVGGKRS